MPFPIGKGIVLFERPLELLRMKPLLLCLTMSILIMGCNSSESGTDKTDATPASAQTLKSEATKGSDLTPEAKAQVEANVDATTARIQKNAEIARGNISEADKQAAIEHYKQMQAGK